MIRLLPLTVLLAGVAAGQASSASTWALDGEYRSVACASDSQRVLLRAELELAWLDASGQKVSSGTCAESTDGCMLLRLGAGRWAAVLYERLSGKLRVVASSGEELWASSGRSINTVTTGDLDGDGADELFVCRTASGAVEVLAPDGEKRFACAGLGNAKGAACGDLDGDGKPEIVAVSAWGRVHVFDATGTESARLEPGFRPRGVAVASPGGRGSVLLFGRERGAEHGRLVVLDTAGSVRFELDLPEGLSSPATFAVSPSGRWAVLAEAGTLVVVDLLRGLLVHRQATAGLSGSAAWLAPGGSRELLLTVSEGNLRALPFVSDL